MQREQLIGLIAALPSDTDMTKLEDGVTELYHNLSGEALAVVLQGPMAPSADEPVKKTRKRRAKMNPKTEKSNGEYNKKIFAAIKRKKDGMAMGELVAAFPDMSAAQIRTQLSKMPVKKVGEKRFTRYHAK